MKSSSVFLVVVLTTSLLYAQTPAESVQASAPAPVPTPAGGWKGNVGANLLMNSGNSTNRTFGAGGLLSYQWGKNKLESTATGAYGRASDAAGVVTTNTKNWKFQQRYDRYLLDPVSAFTLGHIGQDQPAGFDMRYGFALGLSHELWKVDPDLFKYEVGYDLTHEDHTDNSTLNVHSVRLFLQLKWKFSEWGEFDQDLENLFDVQDGEDYRLNSGTSLVGKMTDVLALKFSYLVRLDNVPVPGKKKVDTTTQFGLVATF